MHSTSTADPVFYFRNKTRIQISGTIVRALSCGGMTGLYIRNTFERNWRAHRCNVFVDFYDAIPRKQTFIARIKEKSCVTKRLRALGLIYDLAMKTTSNHIVSKSRPFKTFTRYDCRDTENFENVVALTRYVFTHILYMYLRSNILSSLSSFLDSLRVSRFYRVYVNSLMIYKRLVRNFRKTFSLICNMLIVVSVSK